MSKPRKGQGFVSSTGPKVTISEENPPPPPPDRDTPAPTTPTETGDTQ